jgi:hypothetical protein
MSSVSEFINKIKNAQRQIGVHTFPELTFKTDNGDVICVKGLKVADEENPKNDIYNITVNDKKLSSSIVYIEHIERLCSQVEPISKFRTKNVAQEIEALDNFFDKVLQTIKADSGLVELYQPQIFLRAHSYQIEKVIRVENTSLLDSMVLVFEHDGENGKSITCTIDKLKERLYRFATI